MEISKKSDNATRFHNLFGPDIVTYICPQNLPLNQGSIEVENGLNKKST